MRLVLPILGLLTWATFSVVAATPTFEAQIPQKVRDQLESLVCEGTGSPGVERIDAQGMKKGAPATRASVDCQPHRVQESLPVVHSAQCLKQAGQWSCDRGVDALVVTLPAGGTVAVVPYDLPGGLAASLVTEAARLHVPPFYEPASKVLKDRCTVRQRPGAEFRGAAHFLIECTQGTIALTRDCGTRPCRYFTVTHDPEQP